MLFPFLPLPLPQAAHSTFQHIVVVLLFFSAPNLCNEYKNLQSNIKICWHKCNNVPSPYHPCPIWTKTPHNHINTTAYLDSSPSNFKNNCIWGNGGGQLVVVLPQLQWPGFNSKLLCSPGVLVSSNTAKTLQVTRLICHYKLLKCVKSGGSWQERGENEKGLVSD